MSIENLKAFYQKLTEDKELLKQFTMLVQKEQSTTETVIDNLMKIAAGAGYEFTVEDFTEVQKESFGDLLTGELKAFLTSPVSKFIECHHTDNDPDCVVHTGKPCGSDY